jgi:hypothetical protein
MENPENTNYFPKVLENNHMYDIFKSDRQTYFMIANQISGNGTGIHRDKMPNFEIEK